MVKKTLLENMRSIDASYLLDPKSMEEEIEESSDSSFVTDKTIKIDKLVSFKNHPFRVDEESDQFKQLLESIEEVGVLSPIVVRNSNERGKYEIIAGHCRTRAAELAGLTEIPAKVIYANDYQATVLMAHTNIVGRDSILISEKAKAYRMCIDERKANGISKGDTAAVIGGNKDSKRSVQRYVRLSYLKDELLFLIDDKKLTAQAGFELAFLDDYSQDELGKYISTTNHVPSFDEAKKLRELFENGEILSFERIIAELTKADLKPKKVNKVTFKTKDIAEYFAEDTDAEEMTNVIITLLEKYRDGEFGDIFA